MPTLTDVLLRWRRHRFVIATDIEKMYRQILIHPDDRDLQRIVWKNNSCEEISDYTLNTVTYGLACAPFLAVRTLQQLAQDEGSNFPKGSTALLRDAYVDDILTGADTLEETRELRLQLHQLCKAGGFPLKKWSANDEAIEGFTYNGSGTARCQGMDISRTEPLHAGTALESTPGLL